MKSISIGHENSFKLPLEVVTMAIAVLAQRGAGKSHLASCMAEEMAEAGQQAVAIDPTGAWYGLKSSADGNKAGYPFVVFGGDHADVPLEEHAGEIIARALVERGFSAIIDLSHFRKGQLRRFMADFLETLYRLNRNPLHVFIDEADAIAPQRPGPDEARMLGAMEDLVRRGRRRGIGCTLITQRPQVLNKNVLTQCEVLVAMRLGHPRDIAAIEEWAAVHADISQLADMVKSLPGLPTGNAWFWSPSLDIFQRVKVRARRTFDSGATPKHGQIVRTPKAVAKIDLEKLGKEIQETLDRSKADDPKTLKAEIARLKSEATIISEIPIDTHLIEIEAWQKGHREGLQKGYSIAQEKGRVVFEEFRKKISDLGRIFGESAAIIDGVDWSIPIDLTTPITFESKKLVSNPISRPITKPKTSHPSFKEHVAGAGDLKPSKCERAILTVLAQYPEGRSRSQISILSGYSLRSSGFQNAMSRCNVSGWVNSQGDLKYITPDGQGVLGSYEPLPTGPALLRRWLGDLGKCEAAILEVLAKAYPDSMTKEEVGTAAGYSVTSSGFQNSLSKLNVLELIERQNGALRASPDLF